MLILLIIAFMMVTILETYPMIQQKFWKELIVFGMLLFTGFTLSLLMTLGVELPHLTNSITQFIKKVFNIKI